MKSLGLLVGGLPATLSGSLYAAEESTAAMPSAIGAGNILQTMMGLGVTILLILLLAWAVKRFSRIGPAMGGDIQIIAGRSLGPRERVVVVQVGEEQILVGLTPGRMQTLHVLNKPISSTDKPVEKTGFREQLNRLQGRDS